MPLNESIEKAIKWFEKTLLGCNIVNDRELMEVCSTALYALKELQKQIKHNNVEGEHVDDG